MLEALKLFALAVLQGVAEFLPVSSSSHLALAGKWIGFEDPGVRVELALHLGTLVAVLLYYRARVAEVVGGIFRGERKSRLYAAAILASCVPAAVAYCFFHDWAEEKLRDYRLIGAMLVVTGLFLLSSRLARNRSPRPLTVWRAFLVGIAQACAMVPGVSRSGSTIVLARFLSIEKREAVAFSFLMSAPLLVGGAILELVPSPGAPAEACTVGWGLLLPAMAVSAAVGCLAIRLLMRIIEKDCFWLFGLYCVPMGLFVFFAS